MFWDFLSGSVVENLPTLVGDTGLNPSPGRTHMQLCHAPQPLRPLCPRVCSPQQEKPSQREAHAPQQRPSPGKINK